MLTTIQAAYVCELEKQKSIDFDDMIIQSVKALVSGKFIPNWSHILVDEFQDISSSRFEFLQQLINKGPNVRLTAVGDDWQSIYRFSGGKLELTTRFKQLVGRYSLSKLQKTFRYNNNIADVAGRFVMQKPEQYEKQVITHSQVNSAQVVLLDDLYQG
ncbi:MAG: UvrD-helicase domain-containing protein [Alteromonadales bacterium]|nr:UvrD-helicase domain-containing protein [Alteromonadales bacterium]